MPTLPCAIIGSGPAALVAAYFLCQAGVRPLLLERRPAAGWKLLVAGSSGLNVSYEAPEQELATYFFSRQEELARILTRFPRSAWLSLLHALGEETFVGTSRRYFLRHKTAASLLRSWTQQLEQKGASFAFNEELVRVEYGPPLKLHFQSGRTVEAQTALLALGGGSWETEPPQWPEMLRQLGLTVTEPEAANTGFHLEAPSAFFAAAEGKPIKGAVLHTARGSKQGELMITKYGLEGTPVYTVGCTGPATLDLKPESEPARLAQRLREARGTVWQKITSAAKLSEGALLLLQHLGHREFWANEDSAAASLKAFPLTLLAPRPLSEAISARGGLAWSELTEDLEAQKIPGLFCAGEMLDWDAPTGGFLLQAAASTGFVAAEGIVKKLGVR